MFMAQSRANMAPMNVPPGSPRQTAGSGMMGKGGGGQVSTPGGGGKGGGGQPARPRMFDNNPRQFGGPMPMAPAPTGGADAGLGFQSMIQRYPAGTTMSDVFGAGPRPAGPVQTQAISPPSQTPVLNEYGLPAAFQPSPSPSSTAGYAPQPVSAQNMLQQALGAGPRPIAPTPTPMAPTPTQPPATNQYGLPMGMHPSQMPAVMANIPEGLMAKLQGFGGF